MLAPRLVRRFGNARVLLAGLALSALGMCLLARADARDAYWSAIALPMVLVGIGQGATLGPGAIYEVSGPFRGSRAFHATAHNA